MGYDIFISYSTKDKLFVDALVNKLENHNLRCWYSPRDIPAGMAWPAAISAAIKQIPVMLLVFSGSSNDSEEVSRELTLASNNKCLVIPVRTENILPSVELEYHLTNRHWLDVYDLGMDAAVSTVLEGLARYENLFKRNAGTGADSAPKHTPAPEAADKKQSKRPRGMLLALLLCLLVAGGIFVVMNNTRNSQYSKKIAAMLDKDASIDWYKTSQGGVTVAALRLKPDSNAKEEYLVRVSGFNSTFDGHIFRADAARKNGETRLRTTIGGEPYVLFIFNGGEGTTYQPESRNWSIVGLSRSIPEGLTPRGLVADYLIQEENMAKSKAAGESQGAK